MSARPQVVDTGHTVSVLHRLYEIRYPDGTTGAVFVVECSGDTSQDLYRRAKQHARRLWQERQRQQITGAAG